MDKETAKALAELVEQTTEEAKKASRKRRSTEPPEIADVRRKSHNIIEQKRRQKINDKIDELKQLLGSAYEHQNKATVLEGTIDNIKSLRSVCTKLLAQHRQLQEEYMIVVAEQERLIQNQHKNPRTSPEPRQKNYMYNNSIGNGTLNGLLTTNGNIEPTGINVPTMAHTVSNNHSSETQPTSGHLNNGLPFALFNLQEDSLLKEFTNATVPSKESSDQ